jgi:hypothetical protein
MPQDEYFEAHNATRKATTQLARPEPPHGKPPGSGMRKPSGATLPTTVVSVGAAYSSISRPLGKAPCPWSSPVGQVTENSYTNMSSWVDVAHAFEAIEFTPDLNYLLRSGTTPQRATNRVRGRGNPLIPDGIILDSTGKVIISTDD